MVGNALVGVAAWPSGNLGIWVPIAIAAPYLVTRFWWANGATANSSVDVGVYIANGNGAERLASTGPTNQVGASRIQSVALGTSIVLSPGPHYLAMSCNNTTGTFYRMGQAALFYKMYGLANQASVGTLPSSATLATASQAYMPLFGIANAVTI